MKKFFIPLVLIVISVIFLAFSSKANDVNEEDKFIEDLLAKMTLEEKVGQMTQITLEVVTKEGEGRDPSKPLTMDIDKLRNALVDYKIGSIINTGGAANTVEAWQEIITTIQDVATKETNLKIPILYGIDAIHGASYTLGSTLFPQNITMAASRNLDLVKESAAITSYEIRASGIPWNFNPVLGLGRQPYWPRFWETFGEDSYLAAQLAENYVMGIQGDDPSNPVKAAACIKHYLGDSMPNNGRDRTPAWIPERVIRDILLPPYAAGVKAGALTVMVNSGENNGIPAHSDQFLITEILKGELQFKGFVVSDWEDIKRLHTRDRVAATPKEAVKMAVMAGLDMSMVPFDFSFATLLIELVNEGEVPLSRIDDAVKRILYVKHKLGLFDNPYPNKELINGFASDEFRKVNLKAAQEAITLLKNENSILPLSKDKKVLVTGPTSNQMMNLNGGWTITWQGNVESLYPKEKNTFLEAVQAEIGDDNVSFVQGVTINSEINIEEAVKAAENVDAIFACLGEDPYCETPGNITDLTLDEVQLKLVNELSKTGKPIVLVLYEGRPRGINKIVDKVDAILMGYLPGMEGADATVDIIYGEVNPSGKLPFSYPKTPMGFTTYDYKPLEKFDVNDYDPQWPFGFGLSYTSYEYADLSVTESAKIGESIEVSVKVTNTGKVAGKETVELYVTDLYGSVTRPVKQLKGFEKVYLESGESKVINFTLTSDHLSFHNRENKKVVEPGDFNVKIGNLIKSFTLN
ncbi:MAG: glycoside hydrolase family 3 C-terminal domain-containing protein [Melioribacteraceae bacterium]|nr:glycoside hydrolase family 3 C-terminal domain-containing protein [Melioribacteraceae bacterium]